MNNRIALFLFASFLSSVGDYLLLFAVPIGLGLETNDLRATVLMWLVPAVAVYLSSFFHRKIENRESSGRLDYVKIILSVAVLELVVAFAALSATNKGDVTLLVALFIFFYAFIKEGLPRLLYIVSVYKYFVYDDEYMKIAGLNHSLGIVAGLGGTFLAAMFIDSGDWKLALLVDGITFVIFGLAILFFGTNPKVENNGSEIKNVASTLDVNRNDLLWILTGVAILPIANSLVWNYLPILSGQYQLVSASTAIAMIALLRMPGMIGGFFLEKTSRVISVSKLIRVIPIVNTSVSILFVIFPSVLFMVLLSLVQGCVTAIYWLLDYTIRSKLPHKELVRFNVIALRRIAFFQFASCLCAIVVFTKKVELTYWVPGAIIALSLFAFVSAAGAMKSAAKKTASIVIVVLFLFLVGCGRSDGPVNIRLPSISKDLRLRLDLTYAAFAVLNDVSAHLVTVSHDLVVKPEVS